MVSEILHIALLHSILCSFFDGKNMKFGQTSKTGGRDLALGLALIGRTLFLSRKPKSALTILKETNLHTKKYLLQSTYSVPILIGSAAQ